MTFEEYLSKAIGLYDGGYVVAALTDEYIVGRWSESMVSRIRNKEEKILEIRIFDSMREIKLSRGDIGRSFLFREIIDDERQKKDTFDEIQYLDIDDTKAVDADGKVTATGGGKYVAPVSGISGARIKIRYYLDRYAETGQVMTVDWRIVDFLEGK